ncbi:Glycosyl phosphatidyl inositol anchor synthesis, partial [Spiromyces aspiralis]
LLNALALGVLLAFWAVFFYQHSPPLYYAYVLFPVYFWLEVIKQMAWVREALSLCLTSSRPKWHLPALVVVYVGMLEAMVYGYFDRRLYSLELILMGLGWVLSLPRAFRASHALAIAGWIAGCVVTAIFTMLPVLKAKSAELALSGGLAITLSGLAIFSQRGRFIFPASDQNYTQTAAPKVVARIARRDSALLLFQVAVIGVSTVVVYITQCSIDSGNKSSLPSRWLLWTILLASPAVPFVQLSYYKRLDLNPHFLHRLVSIYLAFATPFIILSISYEPWFYLCFSGVLMMWLAMERASYQFDLEMSLAAPTSQALGYQLATPSYAAPVAGGNRNTNGRYKRTYNVIIDEADDNKETQASLAGESSLQQQQQQQPKHRPLTVRDARTALFFLLFISIAFFGTGNVASMASFNLSSVFRLVTVFRPFLMAVILIFKILIPFILLSAVFGVLNQCLNLPPFSLFLVVLSTTDIMTLNFFFLVRDEGSWLDIGMSISHFCISSLFVLLSIVLFVLSHVLVGRVLVAQPLSSYRDKKRT